MKKLLTLIFLTTLIAGLSVTSVWAASVSRGYHIASVVPVGTLVSVTKAGSNEVELTTTENAGALAGIVTGTDGLVDVQTQGSNVTVATDGSVNLLVSTVNGPISAGDQLVASPVAGIAAKRTTGSGYIAIAQTSLDTNAQTSKQIQVTQNDGSTKTITVGLITAQLTLSSGGSTGGLQGVTSALTNFAQKVAGKEVSLARLVIAASLVFSATVITTVLLYGAVKGTFVALGRNPMSRNATLLALTKSTALAAIILTGGITAAYIFLTI